MDASGNAGGLTSFWGYHDPAQLQANGTLLLTGPSVSVTGTSRASEDPQHGVSLDWTLVLGEVGPFHWGISAGAGYTDFTFRQAGALSGDLVRITDAFALNGIIPPLAPYARAADLPGPLISSTPNRSVATIPDGASIHSQRELAASAYEFRFGPVLELPLSDRLSCSLTGGFAGAWLETNFAYADETTTDGTGLLSARGADRQGAFSAGGFVEAQFAWGISDDVFVSAAAEYANRGTHRQSENGRLAKLDLRDTVRVSAGRGIWF